MSDSDIITTTQGGPNLPAAANPFNRGALPSHINAGTVAIEEARAVAEAQGKLILAKRFPRDPARAYAAIMEACKRPGLAAIAEYSFPRGAERVTGPSIRLAEELARCWGNIDYGIRELSRKDGVSEMEAFAHDLETNTSSSQKFTVRHLRDTRNGPQALKDERDVYELTANMAGRRLRARIMAILPADIVEAAVMECRKTTAGNNALPLADRVRNMIQAFDRLGVTAAHIERWLEKPIGEILPDDFAELTSIYNSIKDGVSKASDWFESKAAGEVTTASAINEAIKAGPAPAVTVPAATTTAPPPVVTTAPATQAPAAPKTVQTPAPAAQQAASPPKGSDPDEVF